MQGDAIRLGSAGDECLDVAAVEVRTPDEVGDPVLDPVHFAGREVQGYLARIIRPAEEHFATGSVHAGALDGVRPVIDPVDLRSRAVQSDAVRAGEAEDHIFDPRAVEVGALDFVERVVGPVHLARSEV